MPDLRFAVIAPTTTGVSADPAWIRAYAQHVEACGFESLGNGLPG